MGWRSDEAARGVQKQPLREPPSPHPVFTQIISFTRMKEPHFSRMIVPVAEAEGPGRESTFGETEALAFFFKIYFIYYM